MNKDNFVCLLLPIIIFILFSFVFLLPVSLDSTCPHDNDDNDDYVMYYLPEDFDDAVPKPTDTGTSLPSTSLALYFHHYRHLLVSIRMLLRLEITFVTVVQRVLLSMRITMDVPFRLKIH